VQAHITSALSTAAVHAKLITSGMGDWRYLDVVPVGAGKLESLEYVRNRLQIAKVRVWLAALGSHSPCTRRKLR
jgi:hypothetical protein